MTHHRISGSAARRRVAAAVLAGAVLAPVAVGTTPAVAATAPKVVCVSKDPALAAKLQTGITAALKNRKGTIALQFDDPATKTTCTLRAATKFDSASVVKATVLGALLLEAEKQKRSLTTREKSLAKAMITKSDNASTSALWKQLGLTKIKRFLKGALMTDTVPGAGGYWGLTQITARDQQKLLDRLTKKNGLLTDANRAYALKLMNEVVPSQRWGTPAGAPTALKIQVKNGWLPRATHGWRVHSIGAFTKDTTRYSMTVLTHGNKTMQDGVNSIQAVARAIHKGITPKAAARTLFVPPAVPTGAVPPTPECDGMNTVSATD
ncbi:serine hydrolase [Streptomyces sp. CAU 1734]|uniref:serine hydrolase n=1 Tax=Streptomyces sp. CAU 1734 TaxID=3140360 RepID=UPI003260AF9C